MTHTITAETAWFTAVGFAVTDGKFETMHHNNTNCVEYDADTNELVFHATVPNNRTKTNAPYRLSQVEFERVWRRGQHDGELVRETTRDALDNDQRACGVMGLINTVFGFPSTTTPKNQIEFTPA